MITTKPRKQNLQLACCIAAILLGVQPDILLAAPKNGKVVAGQGNISQPKKNTTRIKQVSQSMVIDWQSFNIGRQEQVNFQQPNSKAAALNRIFDQNPSQILGQINANGRVFLSNPNGMIFGPHATVNVNS